MRLIDSDKCPCRKCKISYCKSQCQTFYDWLDTPVEAEPVRHGKWIFNKEKLTWECSMCKYPTDSIFDESRTPYCPDCGAKMDGD